MEKIAASPFPSRLAFKKSLSALGNDPGGINHVFAYATEPLTTNNIQNFIFNELHTSIFDEFNDKFFYQGIIG